MYSVLICYFTDALPTPSEKKPSLQTNVNLDKKPASTVTNTVTENPFQMPPEKQSTAKNFEKLTTLPAFGSLSKEESVHPSVRISKSDSTFYNGASVETLYVSPSFKTFGPAKETVTKKDAQKPAQPSIVQRDVDILKSLTEWGESKNTHKNALLKHSSFTLLSSPFTLHPGALKCACHRGLAQLGKCPLIKGPMGSPPLWVTMLH